MKTYRSLDSALAAVDRIEARYQRLWSKLDRQARADRCPGDICSGWDWPTLRLCRPDDYSALCALIAQTHSAAAQVRYFSFVAPAPMEFAA